MCQPSQASVLVMSRMKVSHFVRKIRVTLRNSTSSNLDMSKPKERHIVWVSSQLLTYKNQKPETETTSIQRLGRILIHYENHICARKLDFPPHLHFPGFRLASPAIEKCHRLVPARDSMYSPVQLPGSKVTSTCIRSQPLAVAVACTFACTFAYIFAPFPD